MLRRSSSSIAALAVLLALTTVSDLTVHSIRQAMAQSPTPAPTVPDGTTLRVDSSLSMTGISEALKQKFESQYPNAKVELAEGGTEAALEAVQAGRADLAAIGRSLTPAEQASGLAQTPVSRRKIAIVVGENNRFPGDMTGEQFAQIFQGKIVNWAEVGGANKPIRLIDRPATDTRQALQSYPVFQGAPFQTGATAAPVEDESIDAVIRQLGDDGISYAVLDQVANKPGVKLVSLYGTLPTEASYPFSQPLTYVYKSTPSPAIQAFLGIATTPESQQALTTTPATEGGAATVGSSPAQPAGSPPDIFPYGAVTPAPQSTPNAAVAPVPTPSEVAQAPSPDLGGDRFAAPWWLWLLSIAALLALLWAILRGLNQSGDSTTVAATPVAGAALAADQEGRNSRIVLVPRNSEAAYAYWEVPEAHKQRIRREEGGQKLALRLYDVTGLAFDRHPAHSIEQFACDEFDQDLHVPIPQSDRDYLVELGYVTYQERWVRLAQSQPVRIPAEFDEANPAIQPVRAETSASAATMPILPNLSRPEESFSGGTDVAAPFTAPIDREPIPEVIPEAPEAPEATDAPSADLMNEAKPALGAGMALAGGAVAASGIGQRTPKVRRSQIVLVPRENQDAYAYWEVLEHHKEIAKQHGGENFILRVCDVTGVALEQKTPHRIQQFNCEETDRDRHVTVPDGGDYVAEIGYLAKNGRWLRIARSEVVKIPTKV